MRKAGARHHLYFFIHKDTSFLFPKSNDSLLKNQDEREGDLWYKSNDLLFSGSTSG